ncbi:MAG: DUF1553 domain-containing protein, partial [Planctomycetales bacterium]|nr:DUF1553 domain-containing protein [Planctomycetales bacterium]
MIRSSRWGGNRLTIQNVPAGRYTVLLYVWEDNNPETYSVSVNGREVLRGYNSGRTGHWERLGPWAADVSDGKLEITSRGGAANFSGLEIWRGEYDGGRPVEIAAEDIEFFERRVRPVLVQHCYECHSQDSDEVQGDLLLDSRPTTLRGGVTGPAVVPGDVENSLLIKAVRYHDDLQMPPDYQLAKQEIEDLETWVRRGAPDPRRTATKISRKRIDVAKAREFWSFRPIADPAVPTVEDAGWAKSDVDRFILAELRRRDLQPLAMADKRTLIRRATFDLTGLPPTPEEVAAFEADSSPDAFARVVDRLLDSRHYGERWGRHWMDLVRYADTAGDNSDYPIPQVYRYRNYIIDSFNADKPYDQFLREQIAGDLLPAANDQQRNEQTIATGYIAISRRFGSIIDGYPQHLTIEDTLDNIGRTVLGLTLTCSRCHDHKFDPLTIDDYYGLYGIFASTRYPFPGIELDKKPRDFVPLLNDGKPGKELAYAVVDHQPADAAIQIRGEPTKPGELVPRKFPDVLGGQTLTDEQAAHSGRLQLAQWLTDPANPLTARVMVNRIWQYHFGAGLVKTPSDFGSRGQSPTHPELLDWLASRFVEDGWSIKRMHRRLMLTRVYQLASSIDESDAAQLAAAERAQAIDPTNDWHWRFNRQRLDAESLRDALLAVSGTLDDSVMNEPHPFPPVDKWQFTQHHPFRESYDSQRRSVYLMTARLNARSFFTMFDGADRNASTPRRDSSVTTLQSLYLLNDAFVHEQAQRFAERLIRDVPNDEAARLTRAWMLSVARPPNDDERKAADAWLARVRDQLQMSESNAADVELHAWTSLTRVLLRTNEFLYVD